MNIITQNRDFARVGFVFNKQNDNVNKIPSPTLLWLLKGSQGGFLVAYDFWGDFTYKKPSVFLNDVIKRYEQTFSCLASSCPATSPDVNNGRRYDLKEIAKNLESLKARCAAFPETKRVYTGREDRLFWTAKEHCEMTLRRKQVFTEFDIKQIILLAGGSYSEAKAKSKAIFRWYEERDFKGSARVHEMGRHDNARKQAKALAERTRAHVRSVTQTFINLNEKVTAVAVGEAAQVSRNTATKYLKEMKEEGLI